MTQNLKGKSFDFSLLDNGLYRWVLVIVTCLLWSMIAVTVAGAAASFIAVGATILFIYLGGNYYTLFLRQNPKLHNPHQKVLKKMGGFLGVALFLTFLGWLGILITMAAAFLAFKAIVSGPAGKTATEGRYIEPDHRRMAVVAEKMRPDDDRGIMMGGVGLPTVCFTTNTAIVGTVGSGKSVTMGLIARVVLPGIGSNGKRALIYDASKSWVATLEKIGVPHIITNPFDRRCRPWDIAKDIVTDADAMALAEILVPKPEGIKDPYWIEITQICIAAVVRYFNTSAPGNWTFRDLVIGLRDQSLIVKMCEDDPQLLHYSRATGSENTAANILSSLITNMQKFELVAALWHKSEKEFGNKPFSLEEDWLFGSSVLLLGRSTTSEQPLQALNNILFKRVGQLMMEELPEVDEPTTWIFLDELGSLGKLDFLKIAATELRKYGGALVVGFQSITQLQDNFNNKVTNTILAQFDQVAGLRLSDQPTEDWLRGVFGRVRFKERQISESSSKEGGKNLTVSYRQGEEDVLLRGEMNSIPAFKPKLGTNMRGLYMWGSERWWSEYPPEIVQRLLPRGDRERNFVRMPKASQRMELWTETDWERLNITHLMGETQPALPQADPDINIVQLDDEAELDALLGDDDVQDYLPETVEEEPISEKDQALLDRIEADMTEFEAYKKEVRENISLPAEEQQKIQAQVTRSQERAVAKLNGKTEKLPSIEESREKNRQFSEELRKELAGNGEPLSSQEVQDVINRVNNELMTTVLQGREEKLKRPLSDSERQGLEQKLQTAMTDSVTGTMYSEAEVINALMVQNHSRIKQFQKLLSNDGRQNNG